jgi:predicted porin
MKKTLIAIAALVATGAFAQSSVTISGSFDPSLAMSKTTYGDDTSVGQTFIRNNSRGTSNVTFRITEDLGAGMSAIALYEADFNAGAKVDQAAAAPTAGAYAGYTTTTSANSLGALGGELYLGLTGGFGSFKLGAANTPSLTTQAARQAYGTKLGGGFGTTMGTSHVRESNSIVYATPVFGGFSGAIGYALNSTKDVNAAAALSDTGTKTDIGLNYASGPLMASYSLFNQGSTSAATSNKQHNLAVQYALGAARLYAGYHNESLSVAPGAADKKAAGYNLGVKYDITSAFAAMANYGKLNDKSAADLNQTITSMGVDYAMSKRTTAYMRMENRNVANVVTATSAKSVSTTAFGLQHNF